MRRAAEAWRISGDGLIPVLAVTAACFLLGGLVGCLLASHIGGGGQESLAAYVEGFLRAAQAGEITAPALASLVWDTVRWPLLALLLGFTAHLNKRAGKVILAVVDVLQTIPALALLGIIMVFFGGVNSLTGSTLGAFILSALPQVLRGLQNYRYVIYAVLVLLIINFKPSGLLGEWEFTPRDIARSARKLKRKLGLKKEEN